VHDDKRIETLWQNVQSGSESYAGGTLEEKQTGVMRTSTGQTEQHCLILGSGQWLYNCFRASSAGWCILLCFICASYDIFDSKNIDITIQNMNVLIFHLTSFDRLEAGKKKEAVLWSAEPLVVHSTSTTPSARSHPY
jgi:hypothetical protein